MHELTLAQQVHDLVGIDLENTGAEKIHADRLLDALRAEESRLPTLRALRLHVEALDESASGYEDHLHVAAARFLSYVALHPEKPEEGVVEIPRLFDGTRPVENQIHLLYATIWRPDDVPSPKSHPASLFTDAPIERAWLRLHTQDLAGLRPTHHWLAKGGLALTLPLGLLRLAVEEALTLAFDRDPEDFAPLRRLQELHADDPLLRADDELATHLRALRLRISYYLLRHEDELGCDGLAEWARRATRRTAPHDLAVDPGLEASLRHRIVRSESTGVEAARRIRGILLRMIHAEAPHPPKLRYVLRQSAHRLAGIHGPARASGARIPPMRVADDPALLVEGIWREIQKVRAKGLAKLDERLRDADADPVVLRCAREWVRYHRLPIGLKKRARRLVERVATTWDRGLLLRALRVHAFTFLPLAPRECLHRLHSALRLGDEYSAVRDSLICDLLVVAWLYELPLPITAPEARVDELCGDKAEGRIAARLAPHAGLPPIRLLPAETLGCRRLLRATFETGRRPA